MIKSITFIAILLQFISLNVNGERIFKKNTNNRKGTKRNLDLLRIAGGSDRFDELLVASPSSSAAAVDNTEDTDDRFNELLGGATSSSSATTPKPTSGRFSIPTIYNPPSPSSSVASQAIPQPPPPTLPPASSQPTIKTNYWYPKRTTCITTNTFTCHICILGSDYPSWMDDDSIATGYLFNTEEECCEEFDCDKSNAPSEGPTTEHPTFNRFTQWSPTGNPTLVKTERPSGSPSTLQPTHFPSASPSTVKPSSSPSMKPTTLMPSQSPSHKPTTVEPSASPSMKPITPMPSGSPSQKPTTLMPSQSPSHKPTTLMPSVSPSQSPITSQPSGSPSQKPTQHPSLSPATSQPSESPTIQEDVIPLYNELDTSTYTEGTLVEVDGIVYRCNGFPFTLYCKLPEYKPNSVDTNWQDVWIEVVTTVSPTLSPSTASPTSRPSQAPITLEPSVPPSQAPTTLMPSMNPSLAPTTSKPTQQPVTQSPTKYPSQMPITQSPITSTPSHKPSVPPSLRPSSNSPTFNEITSFPTPQPSSSNNVDTNDDGVLYCPPQYNETMSSTYDEGSQVSVNSIAYECTPFPFNIYCSMPKYRPQSIEEDTTVWENIWKEIGTCLVSDSPSISPTVRPSVSPTNEPTKRPTDIPTSSPSTSPSQSPSSKPTLSPSNEPTSSSPTLSPSFYPTLSPSLHPSKSPTDEPSKEPSQTPSQSPSRSPSKMPSLSPVAETASPTLNKDPQSSQPLCSCAPRSFTVQIDPTKVSCDDNNTIKSNGGILKTECVWKNVNDDSMDADITPVNVKTRFVGFVELGNNRQVISRSVREADAEGNGDTFTFESISASLSPTESIDNQLNFVPYAAGLLFVGENIKGDELNASFMWYYSHSCDEDGVPIVEDDVFGMNTWTSVVETDSGFCPATATDESFIPSYDESAASTYTEGTLVELDGVVYKCNDFPFHLYCKLPEYKPGNSAENWQDVWTAIDAADTIMEPAVTASPTSRPSQAPTTSKPSMRPSLQPVAVATSKPTPQIVLPVDQPTGISSSCPPAYDEIAAPLYKTGSTVEVGGYIYICNGDPYGLYCSWPVFKPTVDGNKWQDTWTKLGPCKGDPQSVPVRPSSDSQPVSTSKPQTEKEIPTLLNTSDGDDTHSPSKSPSAKSAKMMMAKSSKASGACGSKSSKKASSSSEKEEGESAVTATLTIELSDMSAVLDDGASEIFNETCASFISNQLESDEICVSDVECNITNQVFTDPTLSIDIDVDATGDNITNIDFQELVEGALGSSEFVEELEETGLNDFDELESVNVAAALQAIDNNLEVSDSNPSNKKAILWTMFVLAAIGVIVGTLLVQRRSNRKLSLLRPRRSRRRFEKRQQTQYTGSSEEDLSEDKYDNEQVPMGGPPTPMSIATEAFQPPPVSEIRHYNKHQPQTLPPPSIINTSRSRSKQQDDWAASTPSSMDCLPESNSRILNDLHKGDGGRPTRFTKRTLVAPKGKLGIVIKKGPMGCMIHSIKQGSPMEGVLHGEDIIIAFNDENVANYSARQLTMLIARNVDVTKKFTVLSQKQNSAPIPARGSAMRR